MDYDVLLERLLARTICDLKTGCWVWAGYCLRRNGYGQINFSRALGPLLVHRISYAIAYQLPLDAVPGVVRHKCNTRACIRPDHLRAGTQRENLEQMAAEGRSPRGERSAMAKLTSADVLRIRALDAERQYSMAELARQFGVKPSTIYAIVHRINWQHI